MSDLKTIEERLSNAVMHGDLKAVKQFMAAGVDIHAKDEAALRLACTHGHLEIVKFLVEAGADISVNDHQPLKWAVLRGRIEVVKFLVEKGTDIHANDGLAMSWACEGGYLEIVKYFVAQARSYYETNPRHLKIGLMMASSAGHDNVVDFLITTIEWQKKDKFGLRGVETLSQISQVTDEKLLDKIRIYLTEQEQARHVDEREQNKERVAIIKASAGRFKIKKAPK
jgi:ankyrin repeat protein